MAVGLTLRLLRHGSTTWTEERRYTGMADVGLNAVGRAQVDALSLAPESYDRVFTSDLRRCVETAERAGMRAELEPALREFDFGELQGRRWEDLEPAEQAGMLEYDSFQAPGGETVAEFGRRIESFVGGLADGRHLLITHGGVIHHLLRRERVAVHVAPAEWVDLVVNRR